jgi:hypothetical protein
LGIRKPDVAIAQQTGCTPVDTFSGGGFQETQPFTITSDRWQLTYEVSGLEQGMEAGLFITVYSAANDQFVTSTSQEREGGVAPKIAFDSKLQSLNQNYE